MTGQERTRGGPGGGTARILLQALLHPRHDLFAQGRAQDGERTVMQALQIAPDHPDALDHLGMVRAHRLQFEEAHALFGNVVLLQRDFAEGYTSRGLVHLLQGKAARAVRGFEKAIALDPRSMPYRRDLEQAKGVVRNSRSQPLTRRAR